MALAHGARRQARATPYINRPHRRPDHAPILLPLALMLGALAVRVPLLGLTAGYDLRVIAVLARRAAHGQDVYAIDVHRATPWAYFPPLLDLYAGLAHLAAATGWSFYVLAKLPVVAADMAIGTLLYTALQRHGCTPTRAAAGMALYLYNPLALYDGAFYGRFDAIALVFLLLALESDRARLFAPAYALAVTAKTFPLFLLPLLALGRSQQPPRRLALACALVAPLSLPYIITNPGGLLTHTFYLDRFSFGSLSWYLLLLRLGQRPLAVALAHVGVLLYPLALLPLVRAPLYVKAACCYALFTVLSGTLFEQYLLWLLPFLIVAGLRHRRRGALALAALYTVAGTMENEYTWWPGPLHYALLPQPCIPLNVVTAAATVTFVVAQVRRDTPWGSSSPGRCVCRHQHREHWGPVIGRFLPGCDNDL